MEVWVLWRFGFCGGLGFVENVWFYGDLSLCRFEFNGGLGFMEVWVLWRFEDSSRAKEMSHPGLLQRETDRH